jgi:hypothetical protein
MAVAHNFFYENKNAKILSLVDLTDEQKFWKQHSYKRFQLMKQSRQQNNRETQWDNHQKQYEAWRPPKSLDDWQSNIVPPFTTSVVESALSELIDQTLQPRVQARKKEYVPHATVLNYVKDYTWDIGYGDMELFKAIKQNLVLGSTVWQEYYWQDKRAVKQIVSYNNKTGREEYKEATLFDFDDCYGEAVNLWDIWFDPQARSVNTGPYKAQDAIRRYIMHIDVFRNTFLNSRWDKYNLCRFVKPGGDTTYYQFYQPPIGVDRESQVEILWHWIRNPDCLVVLANDIPFYIGPNPYQHKQLPFASGQDVVDPWSIYGKGEPGLLESIQDELTTNRRMRLDRQKLDIYKMIFVSNRETLTDQDLIPAPMKPVYVDDVNAVKAFEYGDINPSAYKEEALLKEDGTRVTGVDDRAQSVSPRTSTATESAILKEATLKRLKMKIWVLSRTLLMEQVRLRVPNILQYYRTPKIQSIMGNDAMTKLLKIRGLASEGRLLRQGGNFYEMEYRTIVTKNKKLERQDNGDVSVLDERGDNFFMVTPDLLAPSATVFNYKLTAEPTFPLSKPLMQQKINELFQTPIIMAAFQRGYYDPQKGADKIMELNDFDPADFLATGGQAQPPMIDPAKTMDYAHQENQMMLNGQPLIGTPYAPPEHTIIHVEFMRSDRFKATVGKNPEILQNFSNHVTDENFAQQGRQRGINASGQGAVTTPPSANTPEGMAMMQGGGVPGGGMSPESAGIMQGTTKAVMPAKMRGSEMLPDFTGRGGAM